jgi:hypothetical protein
MNSYELSRDWFNFCFDNPEKVRPIHTAIYFFAIEHCNRLGWKRKFGFPSQMVMEAIGVKNWRTYSKALNDIVEFGFIEMLEVSKNQYSSNIIAIVKNTKASTKALDKALQKHSTKQCKSTVSIDKQETKNKEQGNDSDILSRYNKYLDVFNSIKGTRYQHRKEEKNVDKNFRYWITVYSPTEIKKAIENHDENFWADEIDPYWLLRQRDTKGDAVDYIGKLLNYKPKPKFV